MKQTHSVGIKIIFFTVSQGRLFTLLSNRRIPECSLSEARSLEDEADVLVRRTLGQSKREGFIEQLYSISDTTDTHAVTVVYYMLVPPGRPGEWISVFDMEGSFADDKILVYAIQRLQWKIEYTNVVYSLLPVQFTLGELQRVYEAILNRSLDKRNFRKKILSLKMLKDTGKKKTSGRARPAEVYTFVSRKPSIVEIL
jgi:8-oxo-dGTP diphosphatase